MKKIKLALFAMLLAPAAAFATIIGDGFTQGNGHMANPYEVDLSQVTQTIIAGSNEPVTDYWSLDVLVEGTVNLAFASATLTQLDVAINGFSVEQSGQAPSTSGIFTLDLQPGTYNFLVTGTASDGFSQNVLGGAVNLGIGGIYTVTTDFAAGDVDGNGTISSVPVPAAIWFMGTALFGMLASARRK